jgi:hypothetical protein
MAYDDDGSLLGFLDWAVLEATLLNFLTLPENISFARISEAIGVLSKVSSGAQAPTLTQVSEALESSKLGHLPIAVVSGLEEAVRKYGPDAKNRLTIKDVESIMSRAKHAISYRPR